MRQLHHAAQFSRNQTKQQKRQAQLANASER